VVNEHSHTLINNNQIFSKAFITCDHEKALNIDAETVIIADNNSLQSVIQYYKGASYSPKLTLLASSHSEVVVALDEEIKIRFQDRTITPRSLNKKDFVLERFKHLSKNEIYDYAGKALFHQLSDFPLTSIETAVDKLYKLNSELDVIWALGRANYMTNQKEKRLLSRKKITKKGYTKSWAPLLKPHSYFDGELGEIFIENGSTGTGKSKKIRKIIEASLNKGLKSVFICHRRSIASTSLQDIDGVGYYDKLIPGQESEIQCLVVVVNSIIKSNFAEFLSQIDLVILEEGRQVFDHIMSGAWKHAEKFHNKVLSLCHQASAIVIADADANDDTIVFAQQLKNKPNIRLLYNKADFSGITIELCRYEYIEYKISQAAKEPNFNPFIVATDTQDRVNNLHNELLELNPALKILTIHGDNNKEKEQQAFLKSPDVIAESYDVIIHNSAITSSVSITTERFRKHFGLFEGIVTSSNVIQMLRRNRPCKHFYVGIKKPFKFPNSDPNKVELTENEFDNKCSLLECEENYDKNNNISALYFSAKHEGFNVIVNSSSPPRTEKLANKTTSPVDKEITHLHNLFILRSDIADCQRYDQQDKRTNSKKKHMTLCHEFYQLIFDTLGIDKMLGNGSFTQIEANKLLDKIYAREAEFKRIKLINLPRKGKPSVGTNTVNNILSKFGLISQRAKSTTGHYKLSANSIRNMNDLLLKNDDLVISKIR